jgi:glycerophosphoryl diester phosphodiesterase
MISIIAHRGYSARYRENSLEAWRRAVEAGADFIEIDVRFTADWQGVCLHDADLARLAGRPERIADLPHAAVEGIEADGQPLAPLLLAAFEAIPLTTGIVLDVKDERPQALAALDSLIGAATTRRIVLGLHNASSVAAMKVRGHESMLALTREPELGASFIEAGCNLLRLWEADVTAERLAAAAERQVPVWITAGGAGTDRKVGDIDAKGLAALAELSIGGVLVNDPATARAALEQ